MPIANAPRAASLAAVEQSKSTNARRIPNSNQLAEPGTNGYRERPITIDDRQTNDSTTANHPNEGGTFSGFGA
jgi:hypothetical protein